MDNDRTDQLKSLVSLFSANIAQYKSGKYDESNTRTDFIDSFFSLLGWDIANKQGFSESYREVVREDKVKIDGSNKAPDYSFRIGGARKFFVEAKKPSVNIKEATEPAYQVRRYAYTAKLPLSILTNFAEFAVYDTRIKPGKDDKASAARIFYCTFDQYEQHFDFIFSTFSKNAVWKGSFDRYVEENKNKKGTSEVDDELLAVIEDWRVILAKNIAKNNPGLSIYNLNTVVQRIIDRIIFLRIAEDRGIEDENLLHTISKTENIYQKLSLIFTKANIKYNSELFTYEAWEEEINIDDKILANIINSLYYPDCPYEFSVLPVEILGSIYERFLGKTIRLRAVKGEIKTAVIEEKPEVKKAGGVYYTPQYIVDYIVRNTVGEKIKNGLKSDKTPDEISKITICDPACGSGSFLVGAYKYLLDYHLDYYSQAKNVKSALKNAKIYEAAFNSYKLTIEEKQRILLNNIYGVDIDSQAVQVTKLSLYLKLLEDEEKGLLVKYADMTLLPVLENNIKCGNSLVGTDFYSQGNLDFSEDERLKVNCFDWEKEFDIIIGNPPYVNGKALAELFPRERNYLANSTRYKCLHQKWDLYVAFIEKSLNLLHNNGYFSMIIPYPFLNQNYASLIRKYIQDNHKIVSILDLSGKKVFKDAVVTNIVLTVQKDNITDKIKINKIDNDNNAVYKAYALKKDSVCQTRNDIAIWDISNETKIKVDDKNCILLGDICFISKGMVLNADEKLAKGKFIKKDLISAKRTPVHIKKYLEAKYMDRYIINKTLYLEWNTKRVPARISRPTFPELYENPKIIINKLGVLKATYDKSKIYCDQTIRVAVLWKHLKNVQNNSINKYLNKSRDELEKNSKNYDERFLLSIINSRMGMYLLNQIRGSKNIDINPDYLKQLPVPMLDLSKKTDKAKHDNLVSLVDKMLELKKQEAAEQNRELKTMIGRQIEGVDKAIDTAVYGLYGLTEDEIKTVERIKE